MPVLDSSTASVQVVFDPNDIIDVDELAARLKVDRSWVFERTRKRAKTRDDELMPYIRMGRYLRFHWPSVCAWLIRLQNK